MPQTNVETAVSKLADRHDVAVLAARDVGSRAWNLDDPDSDFDVQVLFAQEPAAYATLGEYVETVEESTGDVELQGWNVRRFAELLADSNPSAFEFLRSPLRYREFDPLSALEADVGGDFRPIAMYYHYRSLATRQYRKYLHGRLLRNGDLAYLIEDERDGEYLVRPPDGDEADCLWVDGDGYEEGRTERTVSRNLYTARAVLYARYVLETHEFPHLDFPAFLDREGDRFEESFVERTRDLVERKRAGEGGAVAGRVFDPDEVALPEADPDEHAVGGVDRERVNEFVRAALAAGDGRSGRA